jgi:fructose/tagatose bisphosphate aldolase
MPLVNMNDLFKIAKKNKLMVPAYNSTDVQMTLAIMDAFQRAGMPGIVQVAPTNVKLTGYEYIAETTKMA